MQTEFEYGQLQSRIWPCGWKWKFIEGIPKSKRKSLWMTIIECESVFLFFAHYLCDYWNFFTFSSYNPMSKVRYLKTNARHANKMPGINGRIHQDTVNVAIRVPLPFLWFSSKVRLRLAIRFFSFLFFVQWSVYSITLLFYMECDNDELSKRNKSEIDANWWISRQFLPINFLLSRCISYGIVWLCLLHIKLLICLDVHFGLFQSNVCVCFADVWAAIYYSSHISYKFAHAHLSHQMSEKWLISTANSEIFWSFRSFHCRS